MTEKQQGTSAMYFAISMFEQLRNLGVPIYRLRTAFQELVDNNEQVMMTTGYPFEELSNSFLSVARMYLVQFPDINFKVMEFDPKEYRIMTVLEDWEQSTLALQIPKAQIITVKDTNEFEAKEFITRMQIGDPAEYIPTVILQATYDEKTSSFTDNILQTTYSKIAQIGI